jgi:carbonic anhydrase
MFSVYISILLLGILAKSVAVSVVTYQSTNVGDHFAATGGYTPSNWNYNYTQTANKCPACSTTDKCGPACWYAIDSSTNQCGGTTNSPINIVLAEVDDTLEFPTFTATGGGCTKWIQYCDDHVFEVAFSACSNISMTFEGTVYVLQQFHFHTSSEHTIGGGLTDAELHMVHKSAAGVQLVVGVRLIVNDGIFGNTFLGNFWKAAESSSNFNGYTDQYDVTASAPVDPYSQFLPASKTFYTYSGSLTTYPCTEGVPWIVFDEPVQIGKQDIENLFNGIHNEENTITNPQATQVGDLLDARPTQSVGTRIIRTYTDSITETTVSSKNNDDDNVSQNDFIIVTVILFFFTFLFSIAALVKSFCFTDSNGTYKQPGTVQMTGV